MLEAVSQNPELLNLVCTQEEGIMPEGGIAEAALEAVCCIPIQAGVTSDKMREVERKLEIKKVRKKRREGRGRGRGVGKGGSVEKEPPTVSYQLYMIMTIYLAQTA